MKKIMLFIAACNLLLSCSNSSSPEEREEQEKKNVTKRDLTITAANSYSTLFMDSVVVEKFITDQKVADSLARRMRSFYNARNYQFAWFSEDGLTEQARGFWNLHEYVTSYDGDTSLNHKGLQKTMDRLTAAEELSVSASKTFINTELLLTKHFIQYMLNNYEKGYVKRKEMERFIPARKQSAVYLADSLINKKHKDDKYFEDVNASYRGLKMHLKTYHDIVKNGGWPVVSFSKGMYKKGVASPAVATLKKRLSISGDMPGTDTTLNFNDTLETGIKNFQLRHGFTPDGIVTEALVKEMNISAVTRLQQVLMNMDRMRWLAAEPKGQLIVVNIPEFVLHMYEGGKKVFDMVVVVGKEGHNTMMFNGDLNQVVFSPHWNVPPSIVKNEILPAMNENSNYLESQNMEIVNNDGELPEIRQRPGGENALGKVKFLFPNSFNIYFHDTPSKSLFEKDKRAFSHGCIRLKEPEKMANYILRNQPEWTPEKISEAMNAGVEKFVKVKDPIPVIITYYTAWAGENGKLNFREDIYAHDSKLARKMFN
ncbi:L,D-transpeptidase family protein [Lacibacter sp. H375]|uniref:L,D-transpeptidase family protein n=1 Tax=Lacibacter sp. H375 TaxID=3133424 RepID=UPI0030C2D1FB